MADTGRTPEQEIRESLDVLLSVYSSATETHADAVRALDALDRLVAERDEARQYGDRWRRYHDAMTVRAERAEAAEARVADLREALTRLHAAGSTRGYDHGAALDHAARVLAASSETAE